MNPFFRGVVTHPVAVTMVFLAGIVFGLVSLQRIRVELMPDLSYPTLTVRTAWDGAAPQEIESQLSRPIEESLATLDGLVGLQSRSRAGASDVILSFDWGVSMPEASRAAREKLQTTLLPEDAERPLLLRYDPASEPFMRLALSPREANPSPAALMALRETAETALQRELESIKGVAAVRIKGGYAREILVEVREPWLAARRLTLAQVQAALAAENVNIAGGTLIDGDVEYLVRTLNAFTREADLAAVRVRRADGVSVPLGDVALFRELPAERTQFSRLDGAEAIELEIFKEADANVVEVAARVKTAVLKRDLPPELAELLPPTLEEQLPEHLQLRILDDQSAFVELALQNLKGSAWQGGLLAILILFLFLRDLRATSVIGISIPVSVILGFAPIYLTGTTLNLMSLGGLALGVGMLVDNAVVVLESVQRRREEGEPRLDAAVGGTAEVAMAVTASTLTTVAVFLPIVFVEGVAGELFGDLALAVVSSLLASLAVALFLVPTLSALDVRWSAEAQSPLAEAMRRGGLRRALWHSAIGEPLARFRAEGGGDRYLRLTRHLRLPLRLAWSIPVTLAWGISARLARLALALARLPLRPLGWALFLGADVFLAGWARLERGYARLLAGTLRHPGAVVTLALLSFGAALAALPRLGSALVPEVAQGRFTLETALPVGTPLARTAAVSAQAEAALAAHPEVASVFATVGAAMDAETQADEGEHTARLRVELRPGADEEAVREALRAELAALRPLQVRVRPPALFSMATPLEVVVYGWDLDALRTWGDRVAAQLAAVPGMRDVASSMGDGYPEVRITYDRARLDHLGLSTSAVAEGVRAKLQGVVATELHRGDERLEVRVQLAEGERATVEDLAQLNISPSVVPPIPLSAVADLEEAVGPSEIRRVDQQRAAVVTAQLQGIDLGSSTAALTEALGALPFPKALTWEIAGQSREWSASTRSLQGALALAVFLVYVIMASTFENMARPFVILASVPLALVGVTGVLALTGTPVSIVVLIGLIVLAGIVVNNAIVLIDAVGKMRDEGVEIDSALSRAALTRLRPIAITTATTVLGLAPLALGFGAGAEIQAPLALTVIGGLSSSTLLTLLVIPAIYRLAVRK